MSALGGVTIAEILNVRLPAMIFAYARKRLGIVAAAGHNFSSEGSKKGAIIPWGVARNVTSAAIVPGPYRASTSNLAVDATGIPMSIYNGVPLTFTDENEMFQAIEQVEAPAIMEASNAIVDQISIALWNAIAAAYPDNYVSTNVNTPGTAFNYAFFQLISQAADNARFSPQNRVLVAGTSNVLDIGQDSILKYYWAFNANTGMYQNGQPGQILDWRVAIDINQPTVSTVGTASGITVAGTQNIGDTVIAVTGGSGYFTVGDLIHIGTGGGSGTNDENIYQVVARTGTAPTTSITLSTPTTSNAGTVNNSTTLAGNNTNVPYSGPGLTSGFVPQGGLKVAHAASDAITVIAARGGPAGLGLTNGQGPVAFDPRGVMLAMRMPPAEVLGRELLAAPAFVMDQATGIPLALYAFREYHQITIEIDYLAGIGVRSELVIPVLR